MSVRNVETSVSLDGKVVRNFTGIRELGFTPDGTFIASLWTTPPGEPRGTYFTALPISSVEYRRRRPTYAAFCRESPNRLVIWDDWGNPHGIESTPFVLDTLEQECATNGLAGKGGSDGDAR